MGICRHDFGRCLLAGVAARAVPALPPCNLLVLLLLEQLLPDYLEAVRAQLAPGGFRKLLGKGTFFNNFFHNASTFSSSGLPTLATGAWPAQHGIVADLWFDRRSDKPVRAADEWLPFLYLKMEGVRETMSPSTGITAEPFRPAAGRAALAHPAVAGFYTAGGACSVHNDWERRLRNSFHSTRSGDVMLSYRPGYIENFGSDRGVSYGSLYNYDARVPLCFYGPQFRSGVYEQNVESVDFAPTLARVAGVAPPSSSTGRVLGEALIE